MDAACDQPGEMGDVGDQHGANLACDVGEALEIDRARDRCAAAEDQLGPLGAGELPDLIEVHAAGFSAHAVVHGPEPLAGDRGVPTVSEMATHRQCHPHDRVAGLGIREVGREVRR